MLQGVLPTKTKFIFSLHLPVEWFLVVKDKKPKFLISPHGPDRPLHTIFISMYTIFICMLWEICFCDHPFIWCPRETPITSVRHDIFPSSLFISFGFGKLCFSDGQESSFLSYHCTAGLSPCSVKCLKYICKCQLCNKLHLFEILKLCQYSDVFMFKGFMEEVQGASWWLALL